MKIVAPLNRDNEINALIDAGANELYCGLLDKKQWQKYSSMGCVNRRGEIYCNLNSLEELKKTVEVAHRRNVRVVLALNEFYDDEQLLMAFRQAESAMRYGIDAFMISDIGLMLKIRNKYKKIKLYLSSCASVFNPVAIEFYIELGISRLILHRHFKVEEIKLLKEKVPKGLEVEVFVLNERCYNVDGFCSFQHGKVSAKLRYGVQFYLKKFIKKYVRLMPNSVLQLINQSLVGNDSVCCFSFRQETKNVTGEHGTITFNSPERFLYACGLCAIYDFYKADISHLKISGRSVLTDQVCNVSIVKEILGILNDVVSRDSFVSQTKNIVKSKGRRCAPDFCYYNDVYGTSFKYK